MKTRHLIATLLLLWIVAPFVASADRFYIDPVDFELGKTETVQFILENTQEYYGFQAEVRLPDGLNALKGSDGELDITLSSRADDGNFRVNSNVLPDGSLIMGAFSASHKPFSGNDGVLVDLKVSVADSFKGGSIEISGIILIDEQNKDVDFESTSSTIGVMVTGISMSETECYITEGETKALTATVIPECASDKAMVWTSSDPDVATVSAEGLVTALKVGTTTITVTSSNGKTATCEVTVTPKVIEVSGITLSRTELSMVAGETATLTATVAPENATDKTIVWTSSNEKKATVDATGNVKAVGAGEATITATCGNCSAECIVTVLPILAESLTISPTFWNSEDGDEFTIVATILPENATNKAVAYESSDDSIAVVDAEGHVVLLKKGICTITVSTLDGSDLKAECVITKTSGIDATLADPKAEVDVFDTNGILLKRSCTSEQLKHLRPAVYILRSRDSFRKIVIR